MNGLRESIKTIEREALEVMNRRINIEVANVLNVGFFKRTDDSVEIDGVILKDLYIDRYNNIAVKLPKEIFSIDTLLKFRNVIVSLYEKEENQYDHRAGIGIFIDYFKTYAKKLSVDDISRLCDLDDADTTKVDGVSGNG